MAPWLREEPPLMSGGEGKARSWALSPSGLAVPPQSPAGMPLTLPPPALPSFLSFSGR